VVADNSLDIGLLHQFRPRACNFMDQQVGTGPILDDIMGTSKNSCFARAVRI
jgi:hypothetical protein